MANKQKLIGKAQEHLESGEEILASVLGAYETKIWGQETVNNGVLLATDRRLVVYGYGLMRFHLEVFPYERISSFEAGNTIMGKHISFYASSNKFTMKWIRDEDFSKFLELVKERIGKNKLDQPLQADIPEQIKKLAELKESGILSEAEFEQKKAELLAKM